MLIAERARELLEYNPDTGDLVWKPRPIRAEYSRTDRTWNTRYAGTCAGSLTDEGYIRVDVDARPYLAHHIVWLIVYGHVPAFIDHIDCDGTNNKLSNLREATRSQNSANRRVYANNKARVKGVHWNKRLQCYIAQICVHRRKIHIGCFSDANAAGMAYDEAARHHFGEFARSE